jgi:ATP-dependent DNA helicase RecG
MQSVDSQSVTDKNPTTPVFYMNSQEITKGESITVEYKTDSNKSGLSDSKLAEAVVAMANAEGGTIFIGIDKSRQVVGSQRLKDKYWKNERAVEGMLLENTRPSLPTTATFMELEGEPVVCIAVPRAPSTVGTASGKYLKRRIGSTGEPENVPMSPDEIIAGMSRVGTLDFSSTTLSKSSLDEIDLTLVEATAKNILSRTNEQRDQDLFRQPPINILQTIGLLDPDQRPNIAALLLFGRDEVLQYRLPNHFVQYQVFGSGAQVLKNEIFRGPLVRLFPHLLTMPELLRNSDEFRYRGSNVVIPEYSPDSIREAISNALVHRDYALQPGIQTQVYDGELSIYSPGGFPSGVTLQNILSVGATPRNRRLAEAMMRLKFVETSGRGVDFIFAGQARYGRPAPDYTQSTNERVCVRLVGGKANLDFCRFLNSTSPDLGVKQLLVLNALFFRHDLLLREAAELLQSPPILTEQVLSEMHRRGYVQYTNEAPRRYFLKGSLHPSARRAVKPARLTEEQMKIYRDRLLGELGRVDALSTDWLADAVGLSPTQTYRTLTRLRKEGLVAPTRDKKWKLAAATR